MKLLRIISIFFLFSAFSQSQEKELTFKQSILFSFKAGYHTGYDLGLDEGFPDGIVFNPLFGLRISKVISLGVEVDYWKKNSVIVHPDLTTITLKKDYSSYGYRFFVQIRKEFSRSFDINGDIGLGRYHTNALYYSPDRFLNQIDNTYFSLSASVGCSIYFYKNFLISGVISYYGLTDFEQTSTRIFNFKAGPTFLLHY